MPGKGSLREHSERFGRVLQYRENRLLPTLSACGTVVFVSSGCFPVCENREFSNRIGKFRNPLCHFIHPVSDTGTIGDRNPWHCNMDH